MRVAFVALVLGVSSANLLAQAAIGITASGKVVTSAPERASPWMHDVIKTVPPEYPDRDRMLNNQGSGLFRVALDPTTGLVKDVIVRKSTGYASLDNAAVSALRQWRMKPGKWKQFDFPVTYEMARSREDAMQKMRQRQATKPR